MKFSMAYHKALALTGGLLFGALCALSVHWACLGEDAPLFILYEPIVFPFLLLFSISQVPSLYWPGRYRCLAA